jgi:transposase InsO family protein
MKEQTADSVVKAFWKGWVTRHGCPTSLLSDQGKNVDGAAIRALCEQFGITKKRTSSYHPAGNGFAERSIRPIKQILKALIAERNLPQKAWADLLPEVLFGLRATVNESTKYSPFTVVHGRDPLLPHDVLWGKSPSTDDPVNAECYKEG